MHYNVIGYVLADIYIGPHTYEHDRKWGKYQMIKHDPV